MYKLKKNTRHSCRIALPLAVCLLVSGSASRSPAKNSLEASFQNPPHDARPLTWWHWIDGNVTQEGITSDLEAMAGVGIGGAYMFNVGLGLPDGPARFMSPRWLSLVEHAIKESDRLGLDFGVHNCDGFSQAGGPWITAENSMKILTWSSTVLDGPGAQSVKLEQPPGKHDFYRDVAVVAFPVTSGERLNGPDSGVKINGSADKTNLERLIDGSTQTRASFDPAQKGHDNFVVFQFPELTEVRSLILRDPGNYRLASPFPGKLEVSDDGTRYRAIKRFEVNWDVRDAPTRTITIGIKPTSGKYFRFSFGNIYPFGFSEVQLSSRAYPHFWEAKAGWTRHRDHGGEAVALQESPAPKSDPLPAGYAVALKDIRIISDRLSADSILNWDVPAGRWRVLRVGYTSNGKTNSPATREGVGLECDKLDSNAVRFHLDQYVGKLAEDYGEYVGKSLAAFETDSWEAHIQNWTEGLENRFQAAMGYNVLKYLPLLLEGCIIEDPDTSEKMMWDWRRFLADQIAEHYFQTVHLFAKEKGLTYVAEGSGRQQYMYDPITYQRYNDVPMGEFWVGRQPGGWVRVDNKISSSAAHITGRRYVASEAYTSSPSDSQWTNHPYLLKAEGDIAFTKGVNRIVFHTFAHQPFPKLKPGFVMGPWGMHNHQGNTWFRSAGAWYRYIGRCQHLLQQGRFVADVLHYLGEEVPARAGFRDELHPRLPAGYDFDSCDWQALKEAEVKDGIISLPSGMEYRVLLLPNKDAMRPAVLDRIAELISAGATVVGRLPEQSPSLADGAKADAKAREIAARISGKRNKRPSADIDFGKGRIMWGMSFDDVFAKINVPPDFAAGDDELLYIHRKIGARDVYFVSNPSDRRIATQCRFRVTNKQPEFWNPNTGEIEIVARHWQDGRQSVVPLQLDPSGSMFVVFAPGKGAPVIESIRHNGKLLEAADDALRPYVEEGVLKAKVRTAGDYTILMAGGKSVSLTVDALPREQTLSGSWSLRFPDGWAAPKKVDLPELSSWHEHQEDGVKYFSGTVVYHKSFDLPKDWFAHHTILDLGRVEVIAEVCVNGKKVGTLWKPPFKIDITEHLRRDGNELQISVTNLWRNRLIGDAKYPPPMKYQGKSIYPQSWPDWLWKDQPQPGPRRTFCPRRIYGPTDELLPSGLLGPVVLRPLTVRELPSN